MYDSPSPVQFYFIWLVNTCTCTYIVFSWRKFNECLILFFQIAFYWIYLIYKISKDVSCSIFRTHKEIRWCILPTINMNWRGPISKENYKTLLELFFINIWPYMPALKSLCVFKCFQYFQVEAIIGFNNNPLEQNCRAFMK